jgi:hypothetical protein
LEGVDWALLKGNGNVLERSIVGHISYFESDNTKALLSLASNLIVAILGM